MARSGCTLTLVVLTLALSGCLQPNPDFQPDDPLPPAADAAPVTPPLDAGAPPALDLASPPPPVVDAAPPIVPDLVARDLAPPPDLAPAPDLKPPCPTGEAAFAGHCYRVIEGWMSYPEARQACKAQGALPVSIGSATEAAAVYALIPKNLQAAWIGLIRTGDGKKAFVWESGEPLSYTAWAPGEPNNSGYQEDCAEVWGPAISNPSLAGGWNDDACSTLRAAVICERTP